MKQPLKVNILAAEQQWDDCSSSAEKNLIMSISDHLMMVSYTRPVSNGKFRMLFNEGCCFIMRKKISAFTSPYYLLILLFILHIFNMLIVWFFWAFFVCKLLKMFLCD